MIIIRDTREKVDFWDLSHAENFEGEVVKALKSGDYSIEGYENQISIERKKTSGELSINLGLKLKQFKAELERLRSYQVKYVICEFKLSDILNFPENSGIPKKLWKYLRLSGKYMIKLINELSAEYEIEFIFAGSKEEAENTAIEILKVFHATATKSDRGNV